MTAFLLAAAFMLGAFPPSPQGATFTNPLGDGADPWVVRYQGYYYWSSSGGGTIRVSRADKLQNICTAQKVVVWTPPTGTGYSSELWAPEIHYLRGKWYLYVAADNGTNANHRMYVLEGSTQNPQDPFVFRGKISAATDRWAIDGSVLSINDTALYFVWSGWNDTVNVAQNLYIARMSDPLTISGERVLISSPEYAWEKLGGSPLVNEGPEALRHNGDIFIIYSASGSWCDDYCLGQLRYRGGSLLDKASWEKKTTAVFSKTATVFGPGHASFVKSPDNTEDWIVYHAAKYSGAGWNRNIRAQRFTWNADGSPDFGTPVNEGVAIEEPSAGTSRLAFPADGPNNIRLSGNRQGEVRSIYTLQGRVLSPGCFFRGADGIFVCSAEGGPHVFFTWTSLINQWPCLRHGF